MEYIKPCNDENAIMNAAFALEFQELVNEKNIFDLINIYEQNEALKTDLPRKQINHALTLNLDHPQKTSIKNIDGVTFDRLTPHGTQQWSIALNRNSIVISCGEYSRWAEVFPKVKEYFNIVFQALSDKPIKNVGLEYVDVFNVLDNTKDWKGEMLNSNSKYLSSNIFDLTGLWHSHHGFISGDNQPHVKTTLNNFNVDYLRDKQGTVDTYKVGMRTQHKTDLIESIECRNVFTNNIVSDIFNHNHQTNKNIMRDVLSNAMCEEINLRN